VRRLPLALLLVILAGSFAFHAYRAAHPTSSFQSADERSYGKLAVDLAEKHRYALPSANKQRSLHWPPGAPMLFAAAHAAFGSESSKETYDIPAAYWFHAVLALGTTLFAFGFAWALAGVWAGVAAAALVGFYPPLILATGEQISEPFGAFLLTGALCAFALSARRRWTPGYVVSGALLGATVLTRADLLFVPFIVAAACFAFLAWRRRDVRRGAVVGGLLVAGAVLVIGPWAEYASDRAGHFVPVTEGSAAPLFVGTYLPGKGNTVGMKRALEKELKRFRPRLRDTPAFEIPASNYMDYIASKHPDLSREKAIGTEARHNLVKYATGEPLRFAVMMGDKVQRMWTRYARGGARHTSWAIRAWHIALVAFGFAGLVLGVWRGRSLAIALVLLAALYSTALHTLVVSQARYNLPLMPALLAAGVAGWALWWRSRGETAAGAASGSPARSSEPGPWSP
jgi:4-amino-4-deoxy-L-arabinose transferase-like glycosyltransferase